MADIGNDDENGVYLSGIIAPGNSSITCEQDVGYCLNLGKLKGVANLYPITSNSSSSRTENYYDCTKNTNVDNSIVSKITYGKETDVLKSGEPLDSNAQYEWTTTDNWSFENGRYPLPDISQNIPREVWATVLQKANE